MVARDARRGIRLRHHQVLRSLTSLAARTCHRGHPAGAV